MCHLSTSIEPSYRACLRIEPSEPPEPFRAALGGVVVDDSCDGARGFACPRLRSKTWLGEHHTSERRRGRKIVAARGCGRGRSSGCPMGRAIKRDAHARTRQFCFERPLRRVQGMHRASRMCCALFRSRFRLLYRWRDLRERHPRKGTREENTRRVAAAGFRTMPRVVCHGKYCGGSNCD